MIFSTAVFFPARGAIKVGEFIIGVATDTYIFFYNKACYRMKIYIVLFEIHHSVHNVQFPLQRVGDVAELSWLFT